MNQAARTILLAASLVGSAVFAAPAPAVRVGAARIDITPELPIHLVGYANRLGETNEVRLPLQAGTANGRASGRLPTAPSITCCPSCASPTRPARYAPCS